MNLYTIAEPMFADSLWFHAAEEGVRRSRGGRRLHIVRGGADAEFLDAVRKDTGCVWLLGSSARWMRAVLRTVTEYGIFPILSGIGSVESDAPHCLITEDYTESARGLCCRLAEDGCRRIAFFGCNPDSNTDRLKLSGYRAARGLSCEEDIFYNRGDLSLCIREYLARRDEFDGILATNVYVCAALLSRIGRPVPPLGCFGDSPLLDYLCPGAHRASLDYRLAGEKAAQLYPYLCGSERDMRMTVTLRSASASETAGDVLRETEASDPFDPFYRDPAVRQAAQLEQMLVGAEDEDLRLLAALVGGCTYEEAASQCAMGVSTVKYRLKRLRAMSGHGTNADLIRDFARLNGG